MKKYIVMVPYVNINVGAIVGGLSENQYKRRKHALERRKDGAYDVTRRFHFKKGESFETTDDIDKVLLKCVQEKDEYDRLSIEEKLENMIKRELVEFALENCESMVLDPKMKNDDMRDEILAYYDLHFEEIEENGSST